MKRLVIVLVSLVALLLPSMVFANGSQEKSGTKLQVGVVLPTKDEERWTQDETRFRDAFTKAGYNVQILFSQGDSAKEKANVESLISNGVKVIIICPADASAAAAAADEAHAAGVKVISYDRLIRDSANVDYYVTFDSVHVGAAWGKFLVSKATGKGNNLYLYAGAASDNNAFIFFAGRLEHPPAQDRRRHVRDRELQRSRRPPGQGQADPRRRSEDHRPGHHQLEPSTMRRARPNPT